jgi:hypothetical protein
LRTTFASSPTRHEDRSRHKRINVKWPKHGPGDSPKDEVVHGKSMMASSGRLEGSGAPGEPRLTESSGPTPRLHLDILAGWAHELRRRRPGDGPWGKRQVAASFRVGSAGLSG